MTSENASDDAVKKTGPTKGEMSTWDIDRRLKRINQIYILHRQVVKARQALDFSWDYALRLHEGSTSFIIGNSRCGKTQTLRRFIRDKIGKPMPNGRSTSSVYLEGNGNRIVFLDCTNGATPLQASISMLADLFQYRLTVRENQASEKVIHFFGKAKIDMFIIDEGQKMIARGTGAAAEKFANWLLSLENARLFRVVVAGSPDLQLLMDSHPTIRDRKDSFIEIEPFAHKTAADRAAFRKFLREFDVEMPFLTTPLSNPKLDDAFFFATRGRPGRLSKLVEKATIFAFQAKKDVMPVTLEIAHLKQAFDMTFLQESRMHGINPFDHKGDLPTVPRNQAEEQVEPFEIPAVTKRRRQRASKIAG
ncbi:AAA family ATPase [Devosia faecipullorum]|uniref:AAA family ATPase n=1 Tax=Devosia faecipullorum TaxID=2755039 RepID=UPI00187B3405|nr:TniB family NTP-binding protein [Devosia faecipullorum]MBE7731670.1 TniB family NTP-binding protein [Devosia faecipullorum]